MVHLVPDSLLLYQVLATLFAYAIIRSCLFFGARRRRHRLLKYYGIPGPKPNLFDGNMHLYLADGQGYKTNERLQQLYGKYFGVYIADEPSLVISDLELIRQVFLERVCSFKERSQVFMDLPLANSILLARHPRWKVMRKVMSHPFSTYSLRGQASSDFVERSVRLMLDYIEHKLDRPTGTANIDIHDLMKSAALFMISEMAIDLPNVQVSEQEANVKSMDEYLSSLNKGIFMLAVKLPFLKRVFRLLARHFELDPTMALIRRNLANKIDRPTSARSSQNPRLIDTLIALHRRGKLSRAEVVGNAEAILFAGFDTTSTTLAYIFWVLGKHPDVQEKLRQELMAHGLESKYLEQVINETMRLYPTVMSFITRMATETVVLDTLTIPQGTRVVYSNWLMSRDASIWPDPCKFDPERFREGVEIHPCAFAPFGLGERKCLGIQLARLELKLITCEVIMRYKLSTKSPQELHLISYATVLSKPKEKIMIELRSLREDSN